MNTARPFIFSTLLSLVVWGLSPDLARAASRRPDKIAKGIRSKAFKFLTRQQNKDGSYGRGADANQRCGSTAFVVYAFAFGERAYREHDGPFMSRAVNFLLRQQQANGSFGGKADRRFATVLSYKALLLVNPVGYAKQIARTAAYLQKKKWDLPTSPKAYEKISQSFIGNASSASNCKAKNIPDLEVFQLLITADGKGQEISPLLDLSLRTALGVAHSVAAKKAIPGTGKNWLAQMAQSLQRVQTVADDQADNYGGFKNIGVTGFDADPVVATALAGHVADLIKMNYKALAK